MASNWRLNFDILRRKKSRFDAALEGERERKEKRLVLRLCAIETQAERIAQRRKSGASDANLRSKSQSLSESQGVGRMGVKGDGGRSRK